MKIEKEEHSESQDTVVFLVDEAQPWPGPMEYDLDPMDMENVIEVMASFLVWLAPMATWRIEYNRQKWDYRFVITGDMDVCGTTIHVTSISPSGDFARTKYFTEQIKATLSHVDHQLKKAIYEAVLGKSVYEVGREIPYNLKENNNVSENNNTR